ncbi:MAG: hypothetical protein FWF88_03075 [Peptococcaceae bacterium]|nr:hypothetical protein [Peptococcaceae bacterium]
MKDDNSKSDRNKAIMLYEALGGLDDDLIVGADMESGRRNLRKQWLQWGAIAAGVLLMAALLIPRIAPLTFQTARAPFVQGAQVVSLKKINVQKEGIQGLEETLRRYTQMPEKLNIAYLSARVSPQGHIEDFDLLLYSFNGAGEYKGKYRFQYDYTNARMNFFTDAEASPIDSYQSPIVYTENYDVSYISEQIKRIPLREQIASLDFPGYVLQFRANTQITPNQPIIDGGQNSPIPAMSLKEYRQGQGGKSDSKTAIYVTLYDGISMVGENVIIYKLASWPLSTSGAQSDRTPQEYRIEVNRMKVTRDYGETWIDVDISLEDMQETMDFYGSYHTIPEDSFYISPEPGGVIAVIFGKTPKLRLSHDDGATWQTIPFDLGHNPAESTPDLPIVSRIIGFTSSKEGFAALGSNWSAGRGEMKFAYFTHDGGVSWIRKKLPFSGTNRVLTGMSFVDSSYGVLSLQSSVSFADAVAPTLFCTWDGGESWRQTALPEEEIQREAGKGEISVGSLTKVDSLTYAGGVYTLICGKGSGNYIKARFESCRLDGPWELAERFRAPFRDSAINS